jgi:hypothetical protein
MCRKNLAARGFFTVKSTIIAIHYVDFIASVKRIHTASAAAFNASNFGFINNAIGFFIDL